MPTYDYRCSANGRIVEVNHRMSEQLATWGEVCERTGLAVGDTPEASPVERLATGGQILHSASLKNPEAPACARPGCPGGPCGMV